MSDEQFNKFKNAAIEVWRDKDDTYGYATKKINAIKDLGNTFDNYNLIIGMFDLSNQANLASKLDF